MAKTSQIERAIEDLEAKKAALLSKANIEGDAIDAAIRALKAQQRKPSTRKARPALVEEKAG